MRVKTAPARCSNRKPPTTSEGVFEGLDNETIPSETLMSVIDGDRPDTAEDDGPDDEPPQPPRGGRRRCAW